LRDIWKIKFRGIFSLHISCKPLLIVGFEILRAVVMKSSIFWDITPCSPLKVNRSFRETHRLDLQGRRNRRTRNQRETRWQAKQSLATLPGLFLHTEDGGSVFLWNVALIFNWLYGIIFQKTALLNYWLVSKYDKQDSTYYEYVFEMFRWITFYVQIFNMYWKV
jgi:hypothetical protein